MAQLRQRRRSSWLGVIPVLMLAAGCTLDRSFPSLSPRPIEDGTLTEPTMAPPPPGTPSATAAVRYAPIVERAQNGDKAFLAALAEARPALSQGRGAAAGSDAWLAAQQALTRVEAARTPVVGALSDLEAARNGETPRGDTGEALAVAQAYDTVRAIDAAEAAALSAATPGDR